MANRVYLWSLRSTATSTVHISKVSVLYFMEGYYKAVLCIWTYLMQCLPQATPCSWWQNAIQSVVCRSGPDFEDAGGSLSINYCSSNHLLWGYWVALNMTWCSFVVKCGKMQKHLKECPLPSLINCKVFHPWVLFARLRYKWHNVHEIFQMRPLPTQNEKMLVQSPSFHYFSVSRASESVPIISPWPGYKTTTYM